MSQDRLREIIDHLARHSAGASIATARAELSARLHEADIAVPSESWLDAVAREAVHGRSYVLNAEASEIEQVDDPALAAALEEAPALLDIEPAASGRSTGSSDERQSRGPEANASRQIPPRLDDATARHISNGRAYASPAALLCVLAAAVLIWVWGRRHRQRPVDGSEQAD